MLVRISGNYVATPPPPPPQSEQARYVPEGVHPIFVRMMKSKRKGTVGGRINVIAPNSKVTLESSFWPNNIFAGEWLSKQRW